VLEFLLKEGQPIKGIRYTVEQIIVKLRETEIHVAQGKTIPEAVRQIWGSVPMSIAFVFRVSHSSGFKINTKKVPLIITNEKKPKISSLPVDLVLFFSIIVLSCFPK
jgi:hypothetical protein